MPNAKGEGRMRNRYGKRSLMFQKKVFKAKIVSPQRYKRKKKGWSFYTSLDFRHLGKIVSKRIKNVGTKLFQ